MGLSDLGDGLTWGEAKLLIEAAAGDPRTAFGAELAGWAYPASMPELLSLIAQIGDKNASNKVMPWVLAKAGSRPTVTDEEMSLAQAELEDGIVFT